MSIRRGKAANPDPITGDVVRMKGCPDCDGRGWFLINPFSTGGANGCGGTANVTQCLTCLDCKAYWDAHGELPAEIVQLQEAQS